MGGIINLNETQMVVMVVVLGKASNDYEWRDGPTYTWQLRRYHVTLGERTLATSTDYYDLSKMRNDVQETFPDLPQREEGLA